MNPRKIRSNYAATGKNRSVIAVTGAEELKSLSRCSSWKRTSSPRPVVIFSRGIALCDKTVQFNTKRQLWLKVGTAALDNELKNSEKERLLRATWLGQRFAYGVEKKLGRDIRAAFICGIGQLDGTKSRGNWWNDSGSWTYSNAYRSIFYYILYIIIFTCVTRNVLKCYFLC